MLRRNTDASPAELCELLKAVAGRSPCPRCATTGLSAIEASDDEADWPEAPRCEACGLLIDAERIEAIPGATLCAACQQKADRGHDLAPVEYCPRCGAAMVVRPSRGGGITRYVQVCPACRR
jgi:hypothetical protein